MGLVKTRRLARRSLALGVFARALATASRLGLRPRPTRRLRRGRISPWVANPRKGRLRDAEAAAGKGRDEAADEGRRREGQWRVLVARRTQG